ncbi:SDR family NAD(P)-dependent oxidoreductase [Mangrovicoccus algicola]|uniref:SDR family oxidoreductase n=1 Tax=Mangrovicoccus algicola TaxID=2771008 RepID=A0A8J6ZFH0_9RHOB|nr:SDR family oxidoreductase [Mangrovicoccus algicola]MBE3640541.1 SDR family oxidoreductase [Mangrovicoccus algicola]
MTATDALPALVTGASRGLGYAIALALAAKGRHVMAVARTIGGLEELDDEIRAQGGSATLAPMDITEDGAMQHLCRSVHDRWGGLSLWVHAAIHAAPLTPAQMIAQKDWQQSLAVNVDATRRLIAYVAPLLGETGQALFFDDPGVGAKKFHGSYGATKAAQMALAGSWAAETARTGPRVQILTAPPMPTATRARFFPTERPGALPPIRETAAALLARAGL